MLRDIQIFGHGRLFGLTDPGQVLGLVKSCLCARRPFVSRPSSETWGIKRCRTDAPVSDDDDDDTVAGFRAVAVDETLRNQQSAVVDGMFEESEGVFQAENWCVASSSRRHLHQVDKVRHGPATGTRSIAEDHNALLIAPGMIPNQDM